MATFQTQGANRIPRILYFIEGMVPSQDDIDDISRFGPNAAFRNANLVAAVGMSSLEECDAVAGKVPDRYAKVYPNVQGLDFAGRLPRMSDLDRAHGPVHSIDNEAARAARPPSITESRVAAQGADRPAGAVRYPEGGFVAPSPGNPDNLMNFGSERAENGPEGGNLEGIQGARLNPQGLSDAGVALPPTGAAGEASREGAGDARGVPSIAEGGGQGGFRAPEPVKPEGPSGAENVANLDGDTGDTGNTGSTGSTGKKSK